MDDYEIASKLFGTTRTEVKSPSPSVSLIHGTAVENSSNGMVKVRIEGNVTGEDDILEVPTSPYVKAGDDVVIALSGSLGRSPMVMGNTGSGDTVYDDAARAREAADEINTLLSGVEELTEEAEKTVAQILADGESAGANAQAALTAAQAAQTAAATAGTAASQAYEFANGASMSLSEVERVVGTLNWIREHGTYTAATETSPVSGRIYYTRSGSGTDLDPYVYEMVESVPFAYALTEDQSIVSDKTYYTRSGSGTSGDPYVYTPVETPDVSEISTYYERIPGNPYALGYYYLVVDESVQNYLASHLSQTAYGLDLMVDGSDFHMHIGTVNGQMAMGTYVIDANGLVVASFTADGVLVGESGSTHISIEDDGLYVFDDDDIIAAMQKRGNWAELFIGVDTGAGIDFDGEIMINDSSQDPPFGIWYYVTGSGKLKLYKSDGSGGFYKDGHVTREFVNEDMDTDPDPTHTDPRDYGYNIEKYDFYDNARSFKMRVLEKFLGSSSTPTGISDDSYITEQYGYYYEMAFFDEDLVEVSDDFYDAFLLYEPYIGLGGASYSTSDDKGLKFRYGSNGTVMMTDGEVMYPIVTRETWSTSSSTSSLPFNPCFVYDSSHNVFWRCYDGVSRKVNQPSQRAGVIYPYAGTTIPDGFLACDGAAVSRTTYPELFQAIGTTYGAGDGSTTFNVPDLRGRTAIGASTSHAMGSTGGEESHTLTVNEMPSHSHDIRFADQGSWWGSASYLGQGNQVTQSTYYWNDNSVKALDIGGPIMQKGGGQAHNNMQPFSTVQYIISTGQGGGISVEEVISGITTLPLAVQYGGTGATTASGAPFVQKSGDTMTGHLEIKNPSVDRDGTLPSSASWTEPYLRIVDKDGELLSGFRTIWDATGLMRTIIYTWNEKADGTQVDNRLEVQVDKSGNKTYFVTDQAAFRSAISAAAASHTHDYVDKLDGINARIAVWDDANSQWYIGAKTPSGAWRRLIFKDNEILYADENWNILYPSLKHKTVLYDNSTGTNATFSLSGNPYNYNHMIVYYRTDDAEYCATPIYSPGGKWISLTASRGTNSSTTYFKTSTWQITSTEFLHKYHGQLTNGSSSNSNNIYIVRVEAWNE